MIGQSIFSFFTPFSKESYLANVNPSATTAIFTRVFFLLESDHNDLEQRKRNVAFINENYSFEQGDIILVEDDENCSPDTLNLEQIDGINIKHCVKGWDPHESCLKRKFIKSTIEKILTATKNLKNTSSSFDQKIEDLRYLKSMANKVKMQAVVNFPNDDSALIGACENYAGNLRNFIALEDFPVRQNGLKQNIDNNLDNNPTGRLFVLIGSKHLDALDQKVGLYVRQFLESLQGINYEIVSEENFLSQFVKKFLRFARILND